MLETTNNVVPGRLPLGFASTLYLSSNPWMVVGSLTHGGSSGSLRFGCGGGDGVKVLLTPNLRVGEHGDGNQELIGQERVS